MTDPFDTVREALRSVPHPMDDALTALVSIEERLREAESELAQWRDSIATEALVERVRVAERERDGYYEQSNAQANEAGGWRARAEAAEQRVKELENKLAVKYGDLL